MKNTKKLLLFILVHFVVHLAFAKEISSPSAISNADGEYSLVWEDNFDGDVLDETNNWTIEVNGNGGGNNELQYYRRENISVGEEPVSGENCLIITAKKETYLTKTCTSGRLTTQNKMSFKYGKLEARIKLPHTANGLWPAFWLLGKNISSVGWPRCGEIDVLEMGNKAGITAGTQDRYFNGACHWGYYEDGWYPMYAKATTNAYSIQDDFHLFTMIWDDESIKMYLDLDVYPNANPYYEIGVTDVSSDKGTYYYFNKQFFIIFNLAIGGHFPDIFNINNVTALDNGDAHMYVDYVRVYQKGIEDEEFLVGSQSANKNVKIKSRVEMYPNPATDFITVSGEKEISHVEFYNLFGQKMLEYTTSGLLNIKSLSAGNYLVKIADIDGNVQILSLIKH